MAMATRRRQRAERVLGSIPKLRILRALARGGEALSRYEVKRLSGVNYPEVSRHLNELVELGLVRKLDYTDPERYVLNLEDDAARLLVELFRKLDYL